MYSFLDFFIHPAYADVSSPPPAGSNGLSLLVMFGVFILFMYFAVWRPQGKRAKEHRNILDSLAKGDEVVTAGGLLGKVSRVTDQYLVIALNDNVEVTFQKSSIVTALPKGTIKAI